MARRRRQRYAVPDNHRGSEGEVDQVELAEAAIFSLNQAAQRLRTLADQARSPELRTRLRTLADTVDGHARELHVHRRTPA